MTQTSSRSWRQLDLPTKLVSHYQPFSLYQSPLVILELFLKSLHYHSHLWTKCIFVQECLGFPEINVNMYLVLNKPLNVSCFLMLDGCSCWYMTSGTLREDLKDYIDYCISDRKSECSKRVKWEWLSLESWAHDLAEHPFFLVEKSRDPDSRRKDMNFAFQQKHSKEFVASVK